MTQPNQVTFQGKVATIALFLAVLIPAAFGVAGLFNSKLNATANSSWSLSIDEISKTVDTQALPVQVVDNAI